MQHRSLSIAVAQPRCTPGDPASNALDHANAIAAAGARLVVFPEMSLTGYLLDPPMVDPTSEVMRPIVEACAATGSVALVGAAVDRRITTLAVSAAGAAVVYRKTFLHGDERSAFIAGDGPRSITIDGWNIGLGICVDTRIPEHIEATLALGIDLYVAGLVHTPAETDDLAVRALRFVRLGAVPVAFASAAGDAGPLYPETAGHSAIWSADGNVLACATGQPGDVERAVLTDRR